ncbi:MAG: DUF1501 domain-containing protein [Planctomycetes bacterium]|nr:DUF1501 domain-containing protein [Planctomycetota bacterium]
MLRFFGSVNQSGSLARREVLRLGGLAGLAALQPNLTRAAEAASPPRWPGFGRAKSVLLVYTSGGQSQLETWDPKPDAPEGIRSQFAPIQTAVPGVLFGEHTPRLARLADRFTVVRSLSHDDLDHGSATYLALTGRMHRRKSSNPPPSPIDDPTYGAVLRRVRPSDRFPYDAVYLNGPAQVPVLVAPGQTAGFLGRDFDPLWLGDVSQGPIAIGGLENLPELPPLRLSAREQLRASIDQHVGQLERDKAALDMNHLYRQAFELLSSPHCREAFDLSREPEALRDRYGRHRTGQACLLARRLIEAGVPLVTVVWNLSNRGQDLSPEETDAYGWDTHNDIFSALKTHLLPRFDATFSTLLEDLDARGLLETTLVVCMGEFGRAPRIAIEPGFKGTYPGRKHWASVYSAIVAGAGVRRGAVFGASDEIAGQPRSDRVGPWDMAATMFSALGIDPTGEYHDQLGRPFPITVGKPIAGLYGA